MYFKQGAATSTLSGRPLKLVDKFTYLGCNIPSTENVNTCLAKVWKSDQIRQDLFQVVLLHLMDINKTHGRIAR